MKNTITSPSRFYPKQHLLFTVVASVTLGASLVAADAASIAVPNLSFDLPLQGDGGFDIAVTDWTLSGWGGVFNPEDSQFPGSTGGDLPAPADGQQLAFLGDGIFLATPSLTTTAPLTSIFANSTYTLTIALGSRFDLPTNATDSATLSFLANDVLIPGSSATFTTDETSIPPGTFADFTTFFTTSAGSPLVGQDLTARITYAGDRQLMIDNVRVDVAVVPEPTTAFLLVSTLPLLWQRRRR